MSKIDEKPGITDFGYQRVSFSEKTKKVAGVFQSVASRYDVMNDVMSLGIHRLWKRYVIEIASVRPGHVVLDLAGGTGDLAAAFARQVGAEGLVVLADINEAMLATGRDRLLDKGIVDHIDYAQANAEQLPFADNSFDCITIAFGLRNVTDKNAALRSMLRVLKPGGKLLILEFSKPAPMIRPLFDAYSFKVFPWLGKIVVGDADSYRYLAESIRMHPDQETLKNMMLDAGFEECSYHNLTGGIVALHRGLKT
jgi:demethylmenaquinone methyltransferase/2-methoxy-6-polyprenyl-1,4-benzoquinol methylase